MVNCLRCAVGTFLRGHKLMVDCYHSPIKSNELRVQSGHFDTTSGHFVEDKFKMSQRDAWLDEVFCFSAFVFCFCFVFFFLFSRPSIMWDILTPGSMGYGTPGVKTPRVY